MRIAKIVLRVVLIICIVLILGGLAGWYFFLRSQEASTAALDSARGLDEPSPTFGGTQGSTATDITAGDQSGTPQASHTIVRLWQVDPTPVAGYGFSLADSYTGTSTDLYYAQRSSGYIFDAQAATESVVRLTDTLIPKTYQALFAPNGVILRGVDQNGIITTLMGSFATTTNGTSTLPQALTAKALPENIRAIALDPKTGTLLYLTGGTDSGIEATVAGWNNVKPSQIFTSPIGDWRPEFGSIGMVLLESPADDTPGYAYTLSPKGALAPLLGPVDGLTILLDPSENALLYSSSSNGALALYAQVGKNTPVQLPIKTVAEKCVWAPGQSLIAYCAVPAAISSTHFLDDWYQGVLHTSDAWWQVDASAGTAQLLYTPQQSLDVQNPMIDPSDNYIAFTNGSDQSLWMLRIAQ